jgi:predicted AAA+ superfamily ATPase
MIRRQLFYKLVDHLPKREFSIVTGPRQTGKSTLLKQMEEQCRREGLPTVFLNLENRTLLADIDSNPLNLIRYLPGEKRRIIVFIDEIQYLSDPSNFLKLIYDEHSERLKIVATGSSAFYTDNRFKDSLAGRKRIFHLLTCSFREYLEISGKQELVEELNRISSARDYKTIFIDYLRIELENYLVYGGYPAVISETIKQEKISRLKEIRDSFLKRDIQDSGVVNENAFYSLFRILASQTGNLVNVNELSATLRIKHETVSSYLNILRKCFHISLAKPWFNNLRKELVKMPKVFLLDNGMRNCLLNNFQPFIQRIDKGELWENMVNRLLIDRYGDDSVFFWRTTAGNEVDFVLPHNENLEAIETKLDQRMINRKKYRIFQENYPAFDLRFLWLYPFDEDFFRRIEMLNGALPRPES